jgi:hypothetical protein
MDFNADMDYLFTNELAAHLANRKIFRKLNIRQALRAETISYISANVESPFVALKKLCAVVPSGSVPLLVPMLGNVTALELRFYDDGSDILGQIPSLTRLQSLILLFYYDTSFSSAQFLSLKTLLNLERLCIRTRRKKRNRQRPAVRAEFYDAHFDDLTSALPSLTRLTFEFQCNLSAATLVSLSIKCPALEHCKLYPISAVQTLMPSVNGKP